MKTCPKCGDDCDEGYSGKLKVYQCMSCGHRFTDLSVKEEEKEEK